MHECEYWICPKCGMKNQLPRGMCWSCKIETTDLAPTREAQIQTTSWSMYEILSAAETAVESESAPPLPGEPND